MKFGLLVNDRKVKVVREFVEGHPQYRLEMVELGGRTYTACREEYSSLDAFGAVEAVNSMVDSLSHINDIEKSVSILDMRAGTAESNIEHIRRLHHEQTTAAGSLLLGRLRVEAGDDHVLEER